MKERKKSGAKGRSLLNGDSRPRDAASHIHRHWLYYGL